MPGTPGSYAVTDWVAMDCLRLLTNMLEMAGYANFSYQDEFKKNFQPGDTIRVKFPQEFLVTEGFEYTAQAINRQTTTVTINNPWQIGFEWDSIEKALFLERSESQIREEYNQPAMAQLAQKFESEFMNWAFFNTNNVVGTLASIPTSWDVYAQARQRMVENAGWGANASRGIGVTPGMMRTLITNSLTQFNPSDAISQQYKTGSVGKAAGWDWFESMSCRTHTTGVWANFTTGVTSNAADQGASGTVTVACTTGDTFLRGDIVNFATVFNVNPRTKVSTGTLKQFKIMADATGASSVATLTIAPALIATGPYQNVSNLIPNSAAVTMWPGTTFSNGVAKTGVLGLGLNKMAYAMAGIELDNPSQGGSIEVAAHKKDPNTGLSISIIRAFDPGPRKWINRFDTLVGFGNFYYDRAAVLVASSS